MGTTHNDSDQDSVVHQHGYEDDGGLRRDESASRAVCWRRGGKLWRETSWGRASSNGESWHDDDDEQRRSDDKLCTVTKRATAAWRWSATLCASLVVRCGKTRERGSFNRRHGGSGAHEFRLWR
jgi:hypothetical protein